MEGRTTLRTYGSHVGSDHVVAGLYYNLESLHEIFDLNLNLVQSCSVVGMMIILCIVVQHNFYNVHHLNVRLTRQTEECLRIFTVNFERAVPMQK